VDCILGAIMYIILFAVATLLAVALVIIAVIIYKFNRKVQRAQWSAFYSIHFVMLCDKLFSL